MAKDNGHETDADIAVAKLVEDAMQEDDARTSTKVRAADIVLSRLLQLRELVDLEARVKKLEDLNDEN